MFGNLSWPRLIEVINDVTDGPDFEVCKLWHNRTCLERLRGDAIAQGIGFGNGTWLPPLIAQVEFVGDDVPRVVALIVAISQATYAFAPVVFGMIREFTAGAAGVDSGAAPTLFVVAGLVQGLAICAFLVGRQR